MEDAPSLLKIPKSECPDMWIRLPRHKWPKPWSRMEDPVVPLEQSLYGHLLAGLLWERQFEKVLLKHDWEKVPKGECLFVDRGKGLFLSVYVDDIKTGWKEKEHRPSVESTCERRWFWWANIIPWPCLFGLHSKIMSNKQRYCRQLQEHVRIQNLCWSCRKAALFRETRSKHFLMVLWDGRSCKEMRGEILRTGKQNNSTAIQSRNTIQCKEEEEVRRLENCQKFAHRLFSNDCIWPVLVDLIFCGPWCYYYMDQSLWKTLSNIGFIHSSHMRIQTLLSCGKYTTTMQIRIVSGLGLCRRSWRLKDSVHFRKSHVRSHKLDVQETNFTFTHFYRSWNNFSLCRFTHGWYPSSWCLEFGYRTVPVFPKPTQQHLRSSSGKLVA